MRGSTELPHDAATRSSDGKGRYATCHMPPTFTDAGVQYVKGL
jgi:hypothetical protein